MKRISLIIVYLLCVLTTYGQDVAISGAYSPTAVAVGGTSTLTVNFSNFDFFMSYPPGDVWIQVTIPEANYSVVGTPTGSVLNYFGGFTEVAPGQWFGYNTVTIPVALPGSETYFLYFTVQGDVPIGNNGATLFDTDFDASYSDVFENDNHTSAGLVVDLSLPLNLLDFKGNFVDCNKIDLNWLVSHEQNNNYFEVMRSTDGKVFESVGMVKSKGNRAMSNTYYFTDDKGLIAGNEYYYYRLRQVDMDGTETLHKIIDIRYDCKGDMPELGIFPNPAYDKIFVSVTNIAEETDLEALIVDNNGVIVKKITINSRNGAEIQIKELTPGVYQIQSADKDHAFQPERFIRIN